MPMADVDGGEEAKLRRLERGAPSGKTIAHGGGGDAKVRFFLSAEKKKRIFAKHPEVTTGEMPKAMFWSRYFKAAARHCKRSVRREAGQAAAGGGSGRGTVV